MKKLLLYPFLFISFLILDSCISYHNGFIAPNSVTVNSPNFQIVETIYGQAVSTYFLGLGRAGRNGLIKEAKKSMYGSYKLSKNQMITNVTVDNKTSLFLGGIFVQNTTFISADVVQFGEFESSPNAKKIKSEKTKKLETKKLENIKFVKIGFKDYSESEGLKLKKGTKVLFVLGDKFYKGIVKYREGVAYEKVNVINIKVYDFQNKNWNTVKNENITIRNSKIIGYNFVNN